MNVRQILRGGVKASKLGMTLLEAILAVLILAIGIAGATQLMVQSAKLMDTARDHYVAVNIGKNQLERARVVPFSWLNSMAETGTVVDVNGAANVNGIYKRVTIVTNQSTNLTEVICQVYIKNRVSLTFKTNEMEEVKSLFTNY